MSLAARTFATGSSVSLLMSVPATKAGEARVELLDLRHRLVGVGGVGNEPPALTIHEHVELFEDRLSDQHLVAYHQSFLEGISTFDLDDERFRHAHGLLASIGVLGHTLTTSLETETSDDVGRQDDADRAGVDQSIRIVGSDLVPFEHSASDESLVDRVRQPGLDSNLTHAVQRMLHLPHCLPLATL